MGGLYLRGRPGYVWSAGIFRDVYLIGKQLTHIKISPCAPTLTKPIAMPHFPASGAGKSRRLPCRHDAGIYPVDGERVVHSSAIDHLAIEKLTAPALILLSNSRSNGQQNPLTLPSGHDAERRRRQRSGSGAQRVGFRDIKVRDGLFWINNRM